MFLFYEFFGVVTNLLGGWLGARIGLNKTMNIGLALQVLALFMLLVPLDMLTMAWVMAAQALSGIAKDLNKMSAKSAIKSMISNPLGTGWGSRGWVHSDILQIAASIGLIPGFIFFIAPLILLFRAYRIYLISDPKHKSLFFMFCCFLIFVFYYYFYS